MSEYAMATELKIISGDFSTGNILTMTTTDQPRFIDVHTRNDDGGPNDIPGPITRVRLTDLQEMIRLLEDWEPQMRGQQHAT